MTTEDYAVFNEAVRRLRKQGYQVKVHPTQCTTEGVFRTATLHGKGVFGAFGTPQAGHVNLMGRIAADNTKAFDKFSTAPLVMLLPCDWRELRKHLRFLATEAGRQYSNTYGRDKLPRQVVAARQSHSDTPLPDR